MDWSIKICKVDYIVIMTDSSFPYFKDLPYKSKKERQKRYQYKNIMSADEMKSSFQDMIRSGMKNTSII